MLTGARSIDARGGQPPSLSGEAKSLFGDFIIQVACEYRDKLAERVFHQQLRKPWMKYREIGIVEDLLRSLKPHKVLEWGAGYGTSHFVRLLAPDAEWVAVEHDEEWAEKARRMQDHAGVSVLAFPPARPDWRTRDAEGLEQDFEDYVNLPAKFGPFDFILVDGRARLACLEKCHGLLGPEGVVVLHDANRHFLRMPPGTFPSETEFSDYRNWSGGLWIGSKGRPVSELIDLDRHGSIWRLYNSLGKGLHL